MGSMPLTSELAVRFVAHVRVAQYDERSYAKSAYWAPSAGLHDTSYMSNRVRVQHAISGILVVSAF